MAFVKGVFSATLLIAPLFLALLLPATAWAQTRFQPQESKILLRTESNQREIRRLREALERWRLDPQNIDTATDSARAAILAAIRQGDPRWLGNAKAMLEPWWKEQGIPGGTLFIRALIRQSVHDFEGALSDLDAAIARDPQQPEFWAWRFAIYMVRAEIVKARKECSAIGQRFGRMEQAGCDAVLLYRTGNPQSAIIALERLFGHPNYQGQHAQEWLAFHRGEAFRVAGDRDSARRVWESHLKTRLAGHGLRVALIDLLNREGKYAEAWQLNNQTPRSDALLVAAIQSAQGLKNGQERLLIAELEHRLRQQEARGDSINERPIIRYQLMIKKDVKTALKMAQAAWKTEREPADALLFAEAAVRSGLPEQASALLQWQSETGYRDPDLDRLIMEIRQATPSKERR